MRDITAEEKDNSLSEKADAAAAAYETPTNTANEAAGKVENIDVETTSLEDAETPLAETPDDNAPTTPLALALLFAVAAGISVEEYYRRKAQK